MNQSLSSFASTTTAFLTLQLFSCFCLLKTTTIIRQINWNRKKLWLSLKINEREKRMKIIFTRRMENHRPSSSTIGWACNFRRAIYIFMSLLLFLFHPKARVENSFSSSTTVHVALTLGFVNFHPQLRGKEGLQLMMIHVVSWWLESR